MSDVISLEQILSEVPDEGVMEPGAAAAATVLASISYRRWQALTRLIAQANTEGLEVVNSADALGVPIGPRRHLILHRHHHFQQAAKFISQLGLCADDIRLVATTAMNQAKQRWITDLHLDAFLVAARDLGKDFRLDTVEWGDPPEPVQHRAALIPSSSPKRRIASTQELVVLWAVAHVFGSAPSGGASAT